MWLLEDLDPQEFRIDAVTSPEGPAPERFARIPAVRHHRVDFGLPVGRMPRPPAAAASLARLAAGTLRIASLARRLRPHVVLTGDRTRAMLTGLAAARAAGCPLAFHPQFFYTAGFRNAGLKRGTARRAALVVSNSSLTERTYAALGVPEQRRLLAFNGTDPTTFQPGDSGQVRQQLGLPVDRPLLGIFSLLRPFKGHDVLLRAMQSVLRMVPDAMLVVVGDGPIRRDLERMAAELEVAEAVSFCGFQQDLTRWYQAIDVFVMASRQEPFGLVTVEAMACERPVVATASGGSLDIVVPGETGILVPPEAPEPMAVALVHLLCDPRLRRLMGERGRQRVLTHFDRRRRAGVVGGALRRLTRPA